MEQPGTLGRYQLLRVLGRGSMGIVYEGLDPKLNRQVAVKTILKSQLVDPVLAEEYTARFMREAQAVARLNHPHIVTVFDFGNEVDIAYLVLEFIHGRELKSLLEEKQFLAMDEVVRIIGELLEALNYAHLKGVIHRDVKPANIMLDEQNRVKLTDFGVARLFDTGGAEGTRPGTMVGTPGYMAPEQIKGLIVGPQADIFATGVVLFQCLTLRKPFSAASDWEIYQKIVSEEPPALSWFRGDIPPALEAVVRRALAKDPRERFPSALAMAHELRQSVAGITFDDDATRRYDPQAVGAMADRASHAGGAGSQGLANTATDTERDFWNSIKDDGDLGEFQEFIVRFPDSVFSNLAKNRINRLSAQATGTGAPIVTTTEDRAASPEQQEARHRAQEEARLKAEEEARRQVEQEKERLARKEALRQLEEETLKRAEQEARRKAEEDERQRAEEAERQRAEEAERQRAEEAERQRAEEAERQRAEEAERQRAEEADKSTVAAAPLLQAMESSEAPPPASLNNDQTADLRGSEAPPPPVSLAEALPEARPTPAPPPASAPIASEKPAPTAPGKSKSLLLVTGIILALLAAATAIFVARDSTPVAPKPVVSVPQSSPVAAPSTPSPAAVKEEAQAPDDKAKATTPRRKADEARKAKEGHTASGAEQPFWSGMEAARKAEEGRKKKEGR